MLHLDDLLPGIGSRTTVVERYPKESFFCEGDAADSVFFLTAGDVKLTVLSPGGKEAILAVLNPGCFFGEGCLNGEARRRAGAFALTVVTALQFEKHAMLQLLRAEPAFTSRFIEYLLERNRRVEENLVGHLLNSSEERLARMLLLLANLDGRPDSEAVLPRVDQSTLAEMVGTTRSRVSFFMNRFKKLGHVAYDDYHDTLKVRRSLVKVARAKRARRVAKVDQSA